MKLWKIQAGIFWGFFSRQYYHYVTDRRCKRLGSFAWVFVCVALSELILNIKFGLDLFSHTQVSPKKTSLTFNVVVLLFELFFYPRSST